MSSETCPRCGSDQAARNGYDLGKQQWRCTKCGRRFFKERVRGRNMAEAGADLVRRGISTRDAVGRLQRLFGIAVDHKTVLVWARKAGIELRPRERLKPCTFCGSVTDHKHTCPEYKSVPHLREERVSYMG